MLLFLFFLIIAISYEQLFSNIRSNYDIYGSRLASNDHVVILAENDASRYTFYFYPFRPENYCRYYYTSSNDFILNIAIGSRQNSSYMWFAYLRTNEQSPDYIELGLFKLRTTICYDYYFNYYDDDATISRFQSDSNYASVLKVDPLGEYVYAFFDSFIYIYDIKRDRKTKLEWKTILPDVSYFSIKDASIGITDENVRYGIIAGYVSVRLDSTLPIVYYFRFDPPLNTTLLDNIIFVNDTFVGGTFTFSYNFDYVMSVSIESNTQQIILGIPSYGRTYLLKYNATSIYLTNVYEKSARSVAWMDNGTRATLLLSDTPTLPWSQSQVQVIDTTRIDTNLVTVYALPNNQQIIAFRPSKYSMSFIRVVISSGQPVILTSTGMIIYAPAAPVGYFNHLTEISSEAHTPKKCPPGTYKDNAAAQPCFVCPNGYKSQTTESVSLSNVSGAAGVNSHCVKCLPESFCPPGSSNDVNLSLFPSINQAYPYPNSPAYTNYDDVVMSNTFEIKSKNMHCLLFSPMLWTLIILTLTLMLLLIMAVFYVKGNGQQLFHCVSCVFRRTDLIGEGQLWVGGLLSFAIIVLTIFAFRFGFAYTNRYPIETIVNDEQDCDPSLKNAKLVSNLQLLAQRKLDDEVFIFDMLDKQNWTLKVDFIQTAFKCRDIAVQSISESYRIRIPIEKCFIRSDNATLTAHVSLESHLSIIQINLTGNAYVGAIRICIDGPPKSHNQSNSYLKELLFCQLISDADQTVSQTINVNVGFTKVINRTEGLAVYDRIIYSGIWVPTVTVKSFSDRLAYEQNGNYIRYLSETQILVIEFTETQFFIRNTQEPIVRIGEVIFRNVLYFLACIELFALPFLLFKLTILPFAQKVFKKIFDWNYWRHIQNTHL